MLARSCLSGTRSAASSSTPADDPAYYVLHGEWFEALPELGSPRPAVRVVASGEGNAAAEVDPAAVLRVS